MTNGKHIITIPRANPVDALIMALTLNVCGNTKIPFEKRTTSMALWEM
jgi:hypothetical protein